MLNLLSYAGMSLQSELCLWTLLGLLRTIFDATLFKVNSNLIQVWQMSMPAELAKPVQRVLRTMISGVMLVQCFTVYVYLASYIVLLYPIFLEERPTLVLPWLLLAAVRCLLCELTSLAVGLGACLLLGPARPHCVRFLVLKVASITPAFYMWMLVYRYYSTLKIASAFKLSPDALPSNDLDYGLELAVRRRRTKSLLHEDQLRRNLVANFSYGETHAIPNTRTSLPSIEPLNNTSNNSSQDTLTNGDPNPPLITSEGVIYSHLQIYEDWLGNEITLPRDADRILEQFVVMLFRISAFLKTGLTDPTDYYASNSRVIPINSLELGNSSGDPEPPTLVGTRGVKHSAYINEYPQIFNKKPQPQSDTKFTQMQMYSNENLNDTKNVPGESKPGRYTVTDKIDELNEKQFEDRETSAMRSQSDLPYRNRRQNTEVTFSDTSDSHESLTKAMVKSDKTNKDTAINMKREIDTDHNTENSSNTIVLYIITTSQRVTSGLQSLKYTIKSSLRSIIETYIYRNRGATDTTIDRPSATRTSNEIHLK